jgi:glycosyltransferase involved in cell wall biosynthesis
MKPRVSVCVPNLNTRPFLAERFRTILEQSFQDWELLVYDSYSDDGAWEYISELAAREPRMRAWQGPREGAPGSWTPCVREARGDYVYIATSDDTMPPNCLERLVAALDAHPECDLAHCRLRAIDETGRVHAATAEWWSQGLFAASSGSLLHRLHVRRAPFDGMLHLLGETVYTSITQLLIRRSLFDRIGLFEPTWGSIGDFNWGMRAGLVGNTVHVPDTWGGWRVHAKQATAAVDLSSPEAARKVDRMIDHAIESCGELLSPALRECLVARWSPQASELRAFKREVALGRQRLLPRRGAFIVGRALSGSAPARTYLKSRLLGRSSADWIRCCLEEAGYGPTLIPVPD